MSTRRSAEREDAEDTWEDTPGRRSAGQTLTLVVLMLGAVGLVGLFVATGRTPTDPPGELSVTAPEVQTPATPVSEQYLFAGRTLDVDYIDFDYTDGAESDTAESDADAIRSYVQVSLTLGTYGIGIDNGLPAVAFDCNGFPTMLSPAGGEIVSTQGMLAAAEQFSGDRGCQPLAPPDLELYTLAKIWAVPLLRAMNRSGLIIDFEHSDDLVEEVVLSGPIAPLPLIISDALSDPVMPAPDATLVDLQGGQAVQDDGGLLFQCHPTSIIQAFELPDDPDLQSVVSLLGCTPEPAPIPEDPAAATLQAARKLAGRLSAAGVNTRDLSDNDGVVSFLVDGPAGSVKVLFLDQVFPLGRRDVLVPLADGEVLERGDGGISLRCGDITLTAAPETRPAALPAFESLVTAEGCTPQPPLFDEGRSARQVRLDDLVVDLQLTSCCGDPALPPGPTAIKGITSMGEGFLVLAHAPAEGILPGPEDTGAGEVISDQFLLTRSERFSNLRFACGDSDYALEGPDGMILPDVAAAFAASMADALNCTPKPTRP